MTLERKIKYVLNNINKRMFGDHQAARAPEHKPAPAPTQPAPTPEQQKIASSELHNTDRAIHMAHQYLIQAKKSVVWFVSEDEEYYLFSSGKILSVRQVEADRDLNDHVSQLLHI